MTTTGSGTVSATGEAEARERLERLFATFDRLTPDELGRIGLTGPDEDEHRRLLDEVDAAAARTGRTALLGEARARARDAVMRRYADATLHQTWVGPNWGLSQGTVEDRVAITGALADAAGVAVVEDSLDPETAAALRLPAEQIVGLSTGAANDGSLGRVLETPVDPELGPSRRSRALRAWAVAILVAVSAGSVGFSLNGTPGVLLGLASGALVLLVGLRR